MESNTKWIFNKKHIFNSPSRKDGVSFENEVRYRKEGSNFLRNLGGKLGISNLVTATAIVYYHRFYMFQSMIKFQKYKIAGAALFLASKSENIPVKLEDIIYHSHRMLFRNEKPPARNSNEFEKEADDLITNENFLLMTLGFDFAVIHPHLYILKNIGHVKVEKSVMKFACLLATESLILTTMCLEYSPSIVACFCIHLASIKLKISLPEEEKQWFCCINETVSLELLNKLTQEHLPVFQRSYIWNDKPKTIEHLQHHKQSPAMEVSRKVFPTPKPQTSHVSNYDLKYRMQVAEPRLENPRYENGQMFAEKQTSMYRRELPQSLNQTAMPKVPLIQSTNHLSTLNSPLSAQRNSFKRPTDAVVDQNKRLKFDRGVKIIMETKSNNLEFKENLVEFKRNEVEFMINSKPQNTNEQHVKNNKIELFPSPPVTPNDDENLENNLQITATKEQFSNLHRHAGNKKDCYRL